MLNGATYIENFILNPIELFESLKTDVDWDERMRSRKTASYGKAYNYSQINYPYKAFLPTLSEVVNLVENKLGFQPNNCLINYYPNGDSKMGFHSDQTDILFENTGVCIISLGTTRTLRFRLINNKENKFDYQLTSGSLFYMTNEVQEEWQHAIPKSDTDEDRISLTFRKIK